MATGNYNPRTRIWTGDVGPYLYPLDTYFGEKLLDALDETPDRVLQINHDDNQRLTCKEARMSSIRVAQNLQRLGIKQDDVIGFICRNSNVLLPLMYGCALIGAPINSLHVSHTKEDLRQMFSKTRPKLVFCDHDLLQTTKEALQDIRNNSIIFTLIKKIPVVPYVNELLVPTGSEYHFKPIKFEKPASEKLLAIICSSDLSKPLRGVSMPHTTAMQFVAYKCRGFKSFVSLNFSSTGWGTGLIGVLLAPFRVGETRVTTIQSFNPEICVKLIELYRVTVLILPPVYLNSLISSPLSKTADFSSVRVFSCTGAVVSESLRERFKTAFPNKPLIISYGKTEIFIAAMHPGEKTDGFKVGRTFTNIQVKICDEEGSPLDLGEIGEICAKPEFKFQGYYNSPESTQQVVDSEGFFKTGDLGYMDKDGYIYILDRNNDTFKYKEHLITPAEIENVIESIEGVEHVCVIGIPDPKAVNLPAAVVVKRPDFNHLSEHDITSVVAEKMPFYKQLFGGVYFTNEMPTNSNGRIIRGTVKEFAVAKHKERYNS